jgi:single-strand DNA-binding protein
MNTVVLIGRVGQDPLMKYFETGKVKTSFSIAVGRWNSSTKQEVTDWFNIELWDKQAEIAGEYIKKGKLVALEGSAEFSNWTDKEGNPKERYFIKGNLVKPLGGKKDVE